MWWQFITAIPSLLKGLFGSIDNITNAIKDEKIAQLNAKTEEDRIASQERVNTLEQRRAVMVAEAPFSRMNIIVRMFAASPPIGVVWKLMLWDKVVGSFAGCSGKTLPGTCGIFLTDPLDDNQWKLIGIVYGFYFLYETTMGVTRLIKR